jgi:MFS family permease
LGMVNSIGMAVAGVLALFTGGLIDRMGPKRIYLAGIGLLAVAYLTYGIAQHWVVTIVAMAAYWLGFSTSGLSCSTICGNCLVNRDRATGMMICETVAAGLLGMAGPMIATWLVTAFGGVSVEAIRPLFFCGFAITLVTFAIVLAQMSDRRWMKAGSRKQSLVKDISSVVSGRKELKKWLAITAMSQLPFGMVFPFTQVFAHSAKGANEYVLGAMVTGSALTSIVFAIPIGRLADRIGRKQTLYMTIPLFWLSNLLLVFAPTPAFLIVAGILQGFYFISGPIAAAIERELVSADQMGRWVGITRFSKMTLSALCAFLAGIIWDKVGPQYVFVVFLGIDMLIRMPLLVSLPETLHSRSGVSG